MSGCATEYAIKKAKGQANVLTGDQPTEAHPGYYALLPVSVPFDMATLPIQLLYIFVLFP